SSNQSIFYLFSFIATSIGVYFVYLGYYTPKVLFLAENLLLQVGFKTFCMSASLKEMISASSAAKLVLSLIDPEFYKHRATASLLNVDGYIQGEALSFAYPSQPNRKVIRDVSFSVDKDRSIAFVGPSGSGKSTLVNLLEKFYNPQSGQLFLDSTPLTSISPFQLRSNIALVSQEPVLFRGTIADNVRLGMDDVSEEDVRAACILANAAEFIRDFPEGYSTLVGENSRALSGGQKQ
ncbi:hypothetical protein PMAYCL1PPCAC_14433, partial [Pristionchus mayeri]